MSDLHDVVDICCDNTTECLVSVVCVVPIARCDVNVVKFVRSSCLSFVLALAMLAQPSFAQQKQDGEPKLPTPLLDYVETIQRDDTAGVNSGTISADGRFLYSSALRHNAINVFRRDLKTGKLTHVQTLVSEENFSGVVSIKLSSDGKYAVAPGFTAKTAVLMHVDQETGKLEIADVARRGEDDVPRDALVVPFSAHFSPDSKFVYVSDTRSVGVFKITDDAELEFVESRIGIDNCFGGMRWITLHPKSNALYSINISVHTVVVSQRDPETGKVKVKQVIRDDSDAMGLQGAITSDLSPDGKFLYVSSGRFSGDTAIGVYAVSEDGLELEVVQELFNEEGEADDVLQDYLGGNGVTVSPDGKCVFAAGTRSRSFVCLRRNSKTGRLTYLETIEDGTPLSEDEQDIVDDLGLGAVDKPGAAGIAISPDSKFIYVFVEDSGLIRVFVREDLKELQPAQAPDVK